MAQCEQSPFFFCFSQKLCKDMHAKIDLVDEERYDCEAKVLKNSRDVCKQTWHNTITFFLSFFLSRFLKYRFHSVSVFQPFLSRGTLHLKNFHDTSKSKNIIA